MRQKRFLMHPYKGTHPAADSATGCAQPMPRVPAIHPYIFPSVHRRRRWHCRTGRADHPRRSKAAHCSAPRALSQCSTHSHSRSFLLILRKKALHAHLWAPANVRKTGYASISAFAAACPLFIHASSPWLPAPLQARSRLHQWILYPIVYLLTVF